MQGQATTNQTETVPLPDANERRFTDRSPVAIEIRDIHKTFRIPENRITTFKERPRTRSGAASTAI